MQLKTILFIGISFLMAHSAINAQEYHSKEKKKKRFLTATSGVEAYNLQFASITNNKTSLNSTPRLSYFFNMGLDVDANLSTYLKPFTGIYLKNIGFIVNEGDTKTKHRVYTLGFPLGIKFASKNSKNFIKLGVEYDYNLNYKQKTFLNDKRTVRMNEWFGKQVPTWYPSLFAGIQYEGLSFTVNYYYNNFFNSDYTKDGVQAFKNMNVQLVTLSFGYHVNNKVSASKLKRKLLKPKREIKS